MRIDDAQREMRTALLGGFMGQFVSGMLWLASAALATWSTQYWAIVVLIVGAGITLALYVTLPTTAGAWFTAATLLIFAALGGYLVKRETAQPGVA